MKGFCCRFFSTVHSMTSPFSDLITYFNWRIFFCFSYHTKYMEYIEISEIWLQTLHILRCKWVHFGVLFLEYVLLLPHDIIWCFICCKRIYFYSGTCFVPKFCGSHLGTAQCKKGEEAEAEAETAGRDGDEGELGAGIPRLPKTDGGGFGVPVPRTASDGNGRWLAGGGG